MCLDNKDFNTLPQLILLLQLCVGNKYKEHLLSTYSVPDIVLNVLHLILTTSLQGVFFYYHSHFDDEEIKP